MLQSALIFLKLGSLVGSSVGSSIGSLNGSLDGRPMVGCLLVGSLVDFSVTDPLSSSCKFLCFPRQSWDPMYDRITLIVLSEMHVVGVKTLAEDFHHLRADCPYLRFLQPFSLETTTGADQY